MRIKIRTRIKIKNEIKMRIRIRIAIGIRIRSKIRIKVAIEIRIRSKIRMKVAIEIRIRSKIRIEIKIKTGIGTKMKIMIRIGIRIKIRIERDDDVEGAHRSPPSRNDDDGPDGDGEGAQRASPAHNDRDDDGEGAHGSPPTNDDRRGDGEGAHPSPPAGGIIVVEVDRDAHDDGGREDDNDKDGAPRPGHGVILKRLERGPKGRHTIASCLRRRHGGGSAITRPRVLDNEQVVVSEDSMSDDAHEELIDTEVVVARPQGDPRILQDTMVFMTEGAVALCSLSLATDPEAHRALYHMASSDGVDEDDPTQQCLSGSSTTKARPHEEPAGLSSIREPRTNGPLRRASLVIGITAGSSSVAPHVDDPASGRGRVVTVGLLTVSFYDCRSTDPVSEQGVTGGSGPVNVPMGTRSIGVVGSVCHDAFITYSDQHGRLLWSKTSDVTFTRVVKASISRARKKAGAGTSTPHIRCHLGPFAREGPEDGEIMADGSVVEDRGVARTRSLGDTLWRSDHEHQVHQANAAASGDGGRDGQRAESRRKRHNSVLIVHDDSSDIQVG
ncbi:hypothetical protein CBR_g45958 [Chara braunii]|uniref:Uncharacterized protein n=1 Tax=Chara braunii TaxID=69332 RepID=A0A388LZY0_CHABU|nr:hypothetical protein CBR_g45958 [Chara braunii]|eukprot:GBG87802.1 hypothetical protein CBR_g45958 [Chara braunii]